MSRTTRPSPRPSRHSESAAGPIDILVNNAGIDIAMPFLDTDTALWRRIVEINLFGPLNPATISWCAAWPNAGPAR